MADPPLPLRAANAAIGLKRLGLPLGSLDVDAIEAAAHRKAGGGTLDSAAREGLAVLLASAERDADLTPVGRVALQEYVVRTLAERLRLDAAVDPSPSPVRRPLVVFGLPRTGTTLLQRLLAAHPDALSLPLWLRGEPLPEYLSVPPRPLERSDLRAAGALLRAAFAEHGETLDYTDVVVELYARWQWDADGASVAWEEDGRLLGVAFGCFRAVRRGDLAARAALGHPWLGAPLGLLERRAAPMEPVAGAVARETPADSVVEDPLPDLPDTGLPHAVFRSGAAALSAIVWPVRSATGAPMASAQLLRAQGRGSELERCVRALTAWGRSHGASTAFSLGPRLRGFRPWGAPTVLRMARARTPRGERVLAGAKGWVEWAPVP